MNSPLRKKSWTIWFYILKTDMSNTEIQLKFIWIPVKHTLYIYIYIYTHTRES